MNPKNGATAKQSISKHPAFRANTGFRTDRDEEGKEVEQWENIMRANVR